MFGVALRRWALPVAAVVFVRLLATAVAVAMGFFAISDDDFARVVIAQSFAHDASFDPSGSSWLPLPFWVNGLAMKIFGADFAVARAVSVVLSLAGAAAMLLAGTWLGLDRTSAVIAGLLGAMLPHAVWLNYATVPEGLTAISCVLAIASLARDSARVRSAGVGFVTVACLCRYEAWAIAAILAAFNALDGLRTHRANLALLAVASLLGPVAWLVHGGVNHGDPLFFVERVAGYRRMLGRSPASLLESVFNYPLVLIRAEPELMLSALLLLIPGVRRAHTPELRGGLQRALLAGAGLLAFLVWGDLSDGAPTHHPERPLLTLWLLLCLALGAAIPTLLTRHPRALAALGLCVVGLSTIRSWFTHRDAFIDRSSELAIGEEARRQMGASERLLVDVGDYGYFAVIAGLAEPWRASGIAEGDPRHPKRDFASAQARCRYYLEQHRAQWLVVPRRASEERNCDGAELRAKVGPLVLLRVPPPSVAAIHVRTPGD